MTELKKPRAVQATEEIGLLSGLLAIVPSVLGWLKPLLSAISHSKNPSRRTLEKLSAKQMFERGWILCAARTEAAFLPDIYERFPIAENTLQYSQIAEGIAVVEDAISSVDGRRSTPGEKDEVRGMVEGVCQRAFGRLHSHPCSDILTAVEEKCALIPKIFCGSNAELPEGMCGIYKVFPFDSYLAQPQEKPEPVGFAAILYGRMNENATKKAPYLRERVTIIHEGMHLLLHESKRAAERLGNERRLRGWISEYAALFNVERGQYVDPMFPTKEAEEVQEIEAELTAFLVQLGTGFLKFQPREASTVRQMADYLGVTEDICKLAEFENGFRDWIHRPYSLSEVSATDLESETAEGDSDFCGKPTQQKSAKGNTLNDRLPLGRIMELLTKAIELAEAAHQYPYAWLTRAVEDRFVQVQKDSKKHRRRNVQIRIVPDGSDEIRCEVRYHKYKSLIEELDYPIKGTINPHLYRITVRYPNGQKSEGQTQSQFLNDNHAIRLGVLQWLGLLDSCGSRVLADSIEAFESGPDSVFKTLKDFTSAQQDEASRYALIVDSIAGDIGNYESFTLEQAEAMLAGSACLDFEDVMTHPELSLPEKSPLFSLSNLAKPADALLSPTAPGNFTGSSESIVSDLVKPKFPAAGTIVSVAEDQFTCAIEIAAGGHREEAVFPIDYIAQGEHIEAGDEIVWHMDGHISLTESGSDVSADELEAYHKKRSQELDEYFDQHAEDIFGDIADEEQN